MRVNLHSAAGVAAAVHFGNDCCHGAAASSARTHAARACMQAGCCRYALPRCQPAAGVLFLSPAAARTLLPCGMTLVPIVAMPGCTQSPGCASCHLASSRSMLTCSSRNSGSKAAVRVWDCTHRGGWGAGVQAVSNAADVQMPGMPQPGQQPGGVTAAAPAPSRHSTGGGHSPDGPWSHPAPCAASHVQTRTKTMLCSAQGPLDAACQARGI